MNNPFKVWIHKRRLRNTMLVEIRKADGTTERKLLSRGDLFKLPRGDMVIETDAFEDFLKKRS